MSLSAQTLTPKYVLLLTFFNTVAEGVITLPTGSLSPVRHGVIDARDLQFVNDTKLWY